MEFPFQGTKYAYRYSEKSKTRVDNVTKVRKDPKMWVKADDNKSKYKKDWRSKQNSKFVLYWPRLIHQQSFLPKNNQRYKTSAPINPKMPIVQGEDDRTLPENNNRNQCKRIFEYYWIKYEGN